jgi:penicillin-binding protein 2
MFHRRVLLLAGGFLLVLAVLGSQLTRLSIVEGDDRLEEVQRRLDRVDLLPTVRGSILDRHGRVLAEDRASHDLAAEFEFISGAWALERAAIAARRRAIERDGRAAWTALGREGRREATLAELPAWTAEAERIWDAVAEASGLDRTEIERRLDRIRAEVGRLALAVEDRRDAVEARQRAEGSRETPPPRGPIREETVPHVVIEDLSDAAAIDLERLGLDVEGTISVRHRIRRHHPWAMAVASVDRRGLPMPVRRDTPIEVAISDPLGPIVGRVGDEVWAEDVARRPLRRDDGTLDLGGYRTTEDRIGRSGVEAAMEDRLRGRRGLVRRNLQRGERERVDPRQGDDVTLSIDAALQSRIAALFSPEVGLAVPQQWHAGWSRGEPRPQALPEGWGPFGGAVVVLEVETGEVLAAVSSPALGRGEDLPPMRRVDSGDATMRAFEGVYPPGSILKPIVYASAVAAGVHPADGAIECTGHFFPNLRNVARCWIYRDRYGLATHTAQLGGPLPIEEAIARSCNIYFYELARRLGPAGLLDWLRRFGLDGRFGVGFGWRFDDRGTARALGEHAGLLPDAEALEAIVASGDRVTPVILGIGQGPIAWTPLQAANAYAILARGGEVRDPTILRDGRSAGEARRLPLDRRSVERALEGLRLAVNEPHGTGHHLTMEDGRREPIFALDGVRVWGKTGTAQAPPARLDRDGDGRVDEVLGGLEHAWFVGLVGRDDEAVPRYAVAVVLEHAGSGGRAAGPVAAAAIDAMRLEGLFDREADGDRSVGGASARRGSTTPGETAG